MTSLETYAVIKYSYGG